MVIASPTPTVNRLKAPNSCNVAALAPRLLEDPARFRFRLDAVGRIRGCFVLPL
jgi:hypothetical protein